MRGNAVMRYKNDILGAQLYNNSMTPLSDGMSICRGGHYVVLTAVIATFRYEYDSLHRPLKIFMQRGSATEITTEKIVYGEGSHDNN
jgi:hypothetical protein